MLFRMIYDHALGGKEHTGYRSSVLQRYARYLGGVYYTCSIQVLVFVRTRVVTEITLACTYFVHYHGTFFACVGYDLTKRFLY